MCYVCAALEVPRLLGGLHEVARVHHAYWRFAASHLPLRARKVQPSRRSLRQQAGREVAKMSCAFVKSAAVVAALAANVAMAGAQSYPTKPIHFIATEVPGSATDIQARIIAKGRAVDHGQPI